MKTNGTAERKGQIASIVGIVLNLLLAGGKIALGAVFSLVSVIADGINNLSDCGGSVVSAVSFRIAEKPADKEHPYGHRRVEYVASMMIAFIILALAVEFFRESLNKVIAGSTAEGGLIVFIVLGVSILVKGGMFVYFRIVSKKINSDTLRAASLDSACDCLATLVVIVGLVLSRYTDFPADGYAGILIALFIAWEGIGIVREASSKLLGQAPDEALVDSVKQILSSAEGILGYHDLFFFSYGKHAVYATVHIETDEALSVRKSHERIDKIEHAVLEQTGVKLTAHCDPVNLRDSEAIELEERVRSAIEGMVDGMNVHDFRLVRGAKKKAVFEVGIPFDCKKSDGELRNDVERAVRTLGNYEPSVTIERE
ncbi:MAG: cation diffusion facilitator family transporter [Clostridiales bacterium]|nr:cation diffusion facilitator family transporter [Clostridiales bacterium]